MIIDAISSLCDSRDVVLLSVIHVMSCYYFASQQADGPP